MFRLLILFTIFILFHNAGIAQIPGPTDTRNILPPENVNEADTVISKNGFFSLFKGKPGKAALYSLLIPGGGQVYNKKWWKVPLAVGIDGALAYVLISNSRNYSLSQQAYISALSKVPRDPNASSLKTQRDYYRKWKEYAWLWLIAGHLLTVMDAYVDRHLMDFDVSDDLTQRTFNSNYAPLMAKVGIKINLNGKSVRHINPLFPVSP